MHGVGVTTQNITHDLSNAGFDFASRYFAPWLGIEEDPVCGSLHTILSCYYSTLLKKTVFKAFQASPRTGILHLEMKGDGIITISGQAVTVMNGTIRLNS